MFIKDLDYIQEFENLVKNSVVPLAKKDGFKKQELNFYKAVNDIFIVFNFQKSQRNEQEKCGFFINLGIFSPFLHKRLDELPMPKIPKEYDCQIRLRIRDIDQNLPNEYIISNEEELNDIRETLSDLYQKKIYPYLSGYNSLVDMIEYFKKTDPNDHRYDRHQIFLTHMK